MTIKEQENEAAIRELVDGFVRALRAKDIDGVMAVFTRDVVSFDLGPPLQHGGGEEFVKRIAHEQISVPVDVRHGKALLDLKP